MRLCTGSAPDNSIQGDILEPRAASSPPISVLMLGHGAPVDTAGIGPFLERIMAPRSLSDKVLQEVQKRYRTIGGTSPLLPNTLAQARAVEAYLGGEGQGALSRVLGRWTYARVFVGMRYSTPELEEAVIHALDHGNGEAVGLIMASHVPSASQAGYRARVDAAVEEWSETLGRAGRVSFASSWSSAETYVRCVAERVLEGLTRFGRAPEPGGAEWDDGLRLVFCAHSARVAEEGTEYADSLYETIAAVMDRVGSLDWRLGFQGGRSGGRWMGPSMDEVVADSKAEGVKEVLVVPLGFLSEHLETLYDLDVQVASMVRSMGLRYGRLLTPGTNPLLIRTLADSVIGTVGSSVGELEQEE